MIAISITCVFYMQAPLSSLILLCVVPFFEPVFSLPWILSMEAAVSSLCTYILLWWWFIQEHIELMCFWFSIKASYAQIIVI